MSFRRPVRSTTPLILWLRNTPKICWFCKVKLIVNYISKKSADLAHHLWHILLSQPMAHLQKLLHSTPGRVPLPKIPLLIEIVGKWIYPLCNLVQKVIYQTSSAIYENSHSHISRQAMPC